ncbi:antibiotic biosynthesis monooxygenase [Deefgea tanakiae]|uniref:Antibiotic biosynthesis monooxygenase n=1 Tax=Deefgea tanakiae TaxID=2865840 RepID=A0ABX8Z9K3_9NEIS|nr:putative quinol monooxygenase [Deefgea tanakiae]QZA79243.1 antibiotic biosynthesis monooxygenase [Deefgea tanakiae]
MTLPVIAVIDAKPEFNDEVELALRDMLLPTRAEGGCLQYELTQDQASSTRWIMVERWQDELALERHLVSAHMDQLGVALSGRIIDLKIYRLNLIA